MLKLALPFCLCLIASSHAFGQASLEILSHGFNGITGFRKWIPVVVKISNKGAALKGKLEIRPGDPTNFGGVSTYDPSVARPIELPQNGKKVFVLTTLLSSGSVARVRLMDEDDTVLATAITNAFTRATRVALVLGRRGPVESAIRSKIGVPRADLANVLSNTQFAAFRPEWLPEHWIGYDSVNLIFVHGESLNDLRPQQVLALKEKVASGGTLIICYDGRTNFTGTLLEDMLPGRFKSEETVSESGLRIRPFEIQEGRILQSTGKLPLAVERRFGAGRVLVLTFDLNQPELQAWSEWPLLVSYLFQTGRTLPPPGYTNAARAAASQFPELEAPSFVGIGFFLFVCVVVIGPANYLFLKARNRKEWTFITVPALSIFFAIVSYFWTIIIRGGSSIIKQSSLIHLNTESDYARRDVWTGILSQSRGSSRFVPKTSSVNWKTTDVSDQYRRGNRTSLGNSFHWGNPAGLDSMTLIPEPLRTHIWSYEFIRTADVVRPGRLVASLELTDAGLKAQIVNRTRYTLQFNRFSFGSVVYMAEGTMQVKEVQADVSAEPKQVAREMANPRIERSHRAFHLALDPGHGVNAVLKPNRTGNQHNNMRDRSIHLMDVPFAQVGGSISKGDSPVFELEGFKASKRSASTFFARLPVQLTNETTWPHGSLQINVTDATPNQVYLCYDDPLTGHYQNYNFGQNDNRRDAAIRHWYQMYFQQRAYAEFTCAVPPNTLDWETVIADAILIPANVQIGMTCWNPAEKKWVRLGKGLSGEVTNLIDRKERSLRFRLSSNQGGNLNDFTISLHKGAE